MTSGIPITRPVKPTFNAGSGLRSPFDKDDLTNAHKKNNVTNASTFGLAIAVSRLERIVAQLRRRVIGGGSSTPSIAIQDFKIVSDGGDSYNCHTFDGVTAGATIIKVAKNQDLRCILPTATPAGGAWAAKAIRGIYYIYSDGLSGTISYLPVAGTTADGVNVIEYVRYVNGSDIATGTILSSEIDNVTPPLIVGDIITADATTFAGPATLVGVLWKAQADGRAWAAKPPPPPS